MLRIAEFPLAELAALLERYGLDCQIVPPTDSIPGSFWGYEEAGLIGNTLYLRADTPIHSALHEACHYICMSPERRSQLHTDAGGTDIEESAVCYLQNILAAHLPSFGLQRSFSDMDEWGYSFRLGSTQAWFTQDAEDALQWLIKQELVAATVDSATSADIPIAQPMWQCRKRTD